MGLLLRAAPTESTFAAAEVDGIEKMETSLFQPEDRARRRDVPREGPGRVLSRRQQQQQQQKYRRDMYTYCFCVYRMNGK